jgi:hypothetical protein
VARLFSFEIIWPNADSDADDGEDEDDDAAEVADDVVVPSLLDVWLRSSSHRLLESPLDDTG